MFFFRKKQRIDSPLELAQPANGSTTGPLQRYRTAEAGDDAEPVAPVSLSSASNAASPDYSRPKPVIFTWKPLPGGIGRIRYTLRLSLDAEFTAPLVLANLSQPFAAMRNLFVGTRYYWQVVAEGRRIEPVESEVWSFSTHSAMPRWVYVPGLTNMRDLGGWPTIDGQRVRQGAVYRSSAMSSRRPHPDTGKVLIEELNIRTDLDLRAKEEKAAPVLNEAHVRWCHAPVPAYGDFATESGMERYRDAMRVFADSANFPILCHCRAGADRVGTIAVLLLGLLGVDLDDLAQDYELTSLSIWGKRSRHSAPFQAIMEGLKRFATSETDSVNRQVENYVLATGVTADEIARIREGLLEPATRPS